MVASYKRLFNFSSLEIRKKELVVKARISIATVTKMGKDSAVVSSDVFVEICTALGYMLDDIVGTVLD